MKNKIKNKETIIKKIKKDSSLLKNSNQKNKEKLQLSIWVGNA